MKCKGICAVLQRCVYFYRFRVNQNCWVRWREMVLKCIRILIVGREEKQPTTTNIWRLLFVFHVCRAIFNSNALGMTVKIRLALRFTMFPVLDEIISLRFHVPLRCSGKIQFFFSCILFCVGTRSFTLIKPNHFVKGCANENKKITNISWIFVWSARVCEGTFFLVARYPFSRWFMWHMLAVLFSFFFTRKGTSEKKTPPQKKISPIDVKHLLRMLNVI